MIISRDMVDEFSWRRLSLYIYTSPYLFRNIHGSTRRRVAAACLRAQDGHIEQFS